MASVSGLGFPQSGASGGFSGSLNIPYLIKGLPKLGQGEWGWGGHGIKNCIWLWC